MAPAGKKGRIEFMNRLRLSGWQALAAGSALAVLVSACGSNSATSASRPGSNSANAMPASLNVELDWVPNPDHVGLYYAQNRGYFSKQNLTVNFRVPSSAADPLKLVGLNKADLAISYEPEMFYGQQEGLPVVAVAAVVPVPLNGLIVSPKNPITKLCQIREHSVGFTGLPSDYAFYDTLLHTCHLSATQVPHQTVGYSLVPSILSGKVDSIIGGYRNVEAIQISQEMGKKATDFPADQLGVPAYNELVLVANARRLASDHAYASTVKRFVAALAAGTNAAMKNPGDATTIMQTVTQYKPSFLRVSVPYTLKLLAQNNGMKTGCLSPHAWQDFGNWMKAHKLIHDTPDASAIMTDRYLPYLSC
jgi:putative hydroxymethylpyrimidine transport system substrate-binding protein